MHRGKITGQPITSPVTTYMQVTAKLVPGLVTANGSDLTIASVWDNSNQLSGSWIFKILIKDNIPTLSLMLTDGNTVESREAGLMPRPPRSADGLWLRVHYDPNSGDATFYYRFNDADPFTQLEVVGGVAITPQVSSIPLIIGGENTNNIWVFRGAIYYVLVEVDAEVAEPDFTNQAESTFQFTDARGMTWTLTETAHIVDNVTSNLGLAKPSNSFVAAHLPDAVLQYNEFMASLARQHVTRRYTYTPNIVNRNGVPWDFTGFKDGRYLFLPGNFIAGYVNLRITTLNISQSGIVCITPPIPYIDLDFHNVIILGSTFPVIGDGTFIDSSSEPNHFPLSVVAINQTGTNHLLFALANPGKGGIIQHIEEDDPVQFFDGDRISINFFYKLRDVT